MFKSYFPSKNSEKLVWANNFKQQLPANKTDLGLTDGQVTASVAEATKVINAITNSDSAQAVAHQKVAEANTLMDAAVKILRTQIKNFKTLPGYTDGIGKALQIVGDDTPFDPATFHPKLDAQAFPGHVTLKYKKDGVEGMNIYERLQGESAWTKLVMTIHSPYLDNRPLAQPGIPESREYMCIGVINDHEVGQMSAIVSVVFGG